MIIIQCSSIHFIQKVQTKIPTSSCFNILQLFVLVKECEILDSRMIYYFLERRHPKTVKVIDDPIFHIVAMWQPNETHSYKMAPGYK